MNEAAELEELFRRVDAVPPGVRCTITVKKELFDLLLDKGTNVERHPFMKALGFEPRLFINGVRIVPDR